MDSNDPSPKKSLLIVGPLPPPIGGATVSVQIMLKELAKYTTIQTMIINTSPCDYHKKTSLIKFEIMDRVVTILRHYNTCLRSSDAVLVFATRFFIYSLGNLLLLLARWHHVPLYFKPLGGDLGLGSELQKKRLRSYKLMVLRAASGVFVQTRQLQTELSKQNSIKSHYAPGYRPALRNKAESRRNSEVLRLVFLSQIEWEKGPFLLLDALRILALEADVPVVCDFYGPIFKEDGNKFFAELKITPGAKYCGIGEAGTASNLLTGYDVLAFPTYYLGEGHPGVIIEAMQAGIPVISTQFRSSPELITDGENGFLIPVGDRHALASAVKRLALDYELREKMGKANYQRSQEFRSDLVVSRMLEIMLPGSAIPVPVGKELTIRQL